MLLVISSPSRRSGLEHFWNSSRRSHLVPRLFRNVWSLIGRRQHTSKTMVNMISDDIIHSFTYSLIHSGLTNSRLKHLNIQVLILPAAPGRTSWWPCLPTTAFRSIGSWAYAPRPKGFWILQGDFLGTFGAAKIGGSLVMVCWIS